MKNWENPLETNLPIDLLVWVIRDGKIKPLALKTFLYIKLSLTDRFELNPQLYTQISEGLNITVKTARAHVSELISANFIGFDPANKKLFIRSRYSIVPAAVRKSKYYVTVSLEYLKHFTEFILAASVAYLVRKQLLTAKYRRALINDGAFRSRYAAVGNCFRGYPVSLTYIALFLGKSQSWVDKFKKKAKHLGWIKVNHHWEQTEIPWSQRFQYLSVHNIPLGRAKKYRGMLHLVGTDFLSSSVLVRKRKKSVRMRNESP